MACSRVAIGGGRSGHGWTNFAAGPCTALLPHLLVDSEGVDHRRQVLGGVDQGELFRPTVVSADGEGRWITGLDPKFIIQLVITPKICLKKLCLT